MNRRSFITRTAFTTIGARFAYLAAASGAALTSAGCNVFSDIANWVPVGEAAVNSIVSVLTSNDVVIAPAIQSAITLTLGALSSLSAAILEYQSTTPAPTGALAKVETFLGDVLTNFRTFLGSLSISGNLLGIITGLANVVLSTLAAFMNDLPLQTMSPSKRTIVMADSARVATSTIPIIPKHRTRRAFKRDFEAVLNSAAAVGVTVAPSAHMHLSLDERF